MTRYDLKLKIMNMLLEAPNNIEEAAEEILTRLDNAGLLKPFTTATYCKDCGIETTPGRGSARCKDCWNDKVSQ